MTNRFAASFDEEPPTAARVIHAALDLTREHGLSSWTVGQLACALDVEPRIVHDAAGNRADIEHAVLGVVADQVPVIPAKADLNRRQRLRRHAGAVRTILSTYAGCAQPMARFAATATGPARPLVEEITKLLTGASSDTEAEELARVFLTQVCLLVSLDDEHAGKGAPRWLAYSEGLPFFGHSIDVVLDGLQTRLGAPEPAPWRTIPAHPFDPGPPEFA